jgi:hypothetical protein
MLKRSSTAFVPYWKGNPASTTPNRRFHLLRSKRYQLFILENDAVSGVYDEAGSVFETHEHKGEFKRVVTCRDANEPLGHAAGNRDLVNIAPF